MLGSKISSKGQVTIPKAVREALGVQEGDTVSYEVQGSVVVLKRVEPFDLAFHQALAGTLDEWGTPEDDEAYRDL